MAGPNGHFTAGKNTRIQIYPSTNCTLEEYQVRAPVEFIDTTNFESRGVSPNGSGSSVTFGQGTFGVYEAMWNVRGKWDSQQNRMDSPPGFYGRDDLPQATLWVDLSRNIFWLFYQSLVLSAETGSRVRQDVSFAADCRTNGQYYEPIGSS